MKSKILKFIMPSLILISFGVIIGYWYSLNPIEQYVLRYGGFKRHIQEINQTAFDTLCSTIDGRFIIRRFVKNMSPYFAEFFLVGPDSNKVELFYGFLNMKLPYECPTLNSFSELCNNKDTIRLIMNYANLLWIHDGDKDNNFLVTRYDDGFLLRNVIWGDSLLFTTKNNKWVKRIIKETDKLYD